MNYQKLTLLGNVQDSAHRYTSKNGGMPYALFTVAVDDVKGHTTIFSVVAFGKLGEIAVNHVTKGRQVLVEGRIQVNDKGGFNVIAGWVESGGPPSAAK